MQAQITSSYKGGLQKIRTAETKIILILFYGAIHGIITLCFLAMSLANQAELSAAIQQYFSCEASGTGMECDRSNINQFNYSALLFIVSIMFGFAPAVNLTFVVNWTGAKSFCRVFWITCSKKFSKQLTKTVEQK